MRRTIIIVSLLAIVLFAVSIGECRLLKSGEKINHYGGSIIIPHGMYGYIEEIIAPKSGIVARVDNPDCSTEPIIYPAIINLIESASSPNSIVGVRTLLNNSRFYDEFERRVGRTIASTACFLLNCSHSKKVATCVPIIVVLPKHAKTKKIAIMAKNPDGIWLKCGFGDDSKCGKAWMSFPGSYTRTTVNNREAITVTFKNWKHDWDRQARLVVIFTMPENEEPIEVL